MHIMLINKTRRFVQREDDVAVSLVGDGQDVLWRGVAGNPRNEESGGGKRYHASSFLSRVSRRYRRPELDRTLGGSRHYKRAPTPHAPTPPTRPAQRCRPRTLSCDWFLGLGDLPAPRV